MNFLKAISAVLVSALLIGCATDGANMPLIFGQSHTVGLSIGGSATDQGVELVLGYKDKDIAIVPVSVKQADGSTTSIHATANSLPGHDHQDALSVLGQFELKSDASTPDVGLGKFFATGLAAKKLADGFACKLGSHCGTGSGQQ